MNPACSPGASEPGHKSAKGGGARLAPRSRAMNPACSPDASEPGHEPGVLALRLGAEP